MKLLDIMSKGCEVRLFDDTGQKCSVFNIFKDKQCDIIKKGGG